MPRVCRCDGVPTKIADKILSKEGDYLLALKSNHKYLNKRVKKAFEESRKTGRKTVKIDDFEDKSKGHGRVERRVSRVITPKGHEKLKINVLSK